MTPCTCPTETCTPSRVQGFDNAPHHAPSRHFERHDQAILHHYPLRSPSGDFTLQDVKTLVNRWRSAWATAAACSAEAKRACISWRRLPTLPPTPDPAEPTASLGPPDATWCRGFGARYPSRCQAPHRLTFCPGFGEPQPSRKGSQHGVGHRDQPSDVLTGQVLFGGQRSPDFAHWIHAGPLRIIGG